MPYNSRDRLFNISKFLGEITSIRKAQNYAICILIFFLNLFLKGILNIQHAGTSHENTSSKSFNINIILDKNTVNNNYKHFASGKGTKRQIKYLNIQ